MASKLPQPSIHAPCTTGYNCKVPPSYYIWYTYGHIDRSLFKAGPSDIIKSSLVKLEQQIPNTYSPAAPTAARKKPKTNFVVVSILHYDALVYQ